MQIEDILNGFGGWSGNNMTGGEGEDEQETKETPWEDYEDRVRERISMEVELE